MGRGRNQNQASTPAVSTTSQQSPPAAAGTNGQAAAPKKNKPRKTEDEQIAELKVKLAAAEMKKAVKQMAQTNKPLAQVLKHALALRGWISAETQASLAAEINETAKRVAAKTAAAEANLAATQEPTGSGEADDDEIPVSAN